MCNAITKQNKVCRQYGSPYCFIHRHLYLAVPQTPKIKTKPQSIPSKQQIISHANRQVYDELREEVTTIAYDIWGDETDADYMVEINSFYRVEDLLYIDDEETFNDIVDGIHEEIESFNYKLSKPYRFIK